MAQPKPIFARIENRTEVEVEVEVEDKVVAAGKTVKKNKAKLKPAQQVAGA